MNYVSVLMVGVALFAVIYWYAAGRYYYVGPRVKAQLVHGVEGDEGKGLAANADVKDGLDGRKSSSEGDGK